VYADLNPTTIVLHMVVHRMTCYNHIAGITLVEMEKEVQEFKEERKKALAYDGEYEGCKSYDYYWVKDEGETLIVK